jgi:hypothetical protein
MQRFNGSLVTLVALMAASGSLLLACGADPGTGEQEMETAGSVGLELELAPGVELNSISYAITGNGFNKSGSIDVADSTRVRAVIGGIPVGNAFTIRLTAGGAPNPGLSCEGSASFDIAASATTTAAVTLRCRVSGTTGSLAVEGNTNLCPVIAALSAEPAETTVGGVIALSAGASDLDAQPSALAYTWSASSGTVTADGATAEFECTASGPAAVTLTVSDGDCTESARLSVTCSDGTGEEEPVPEVRINELESSGGSPGDWLELYNADGVAADLSGWVVSDNDDTHVYALPAGTVLAPGAFYVVEEAALDFGLGGADSARLFDSTGSLVDSYSWTAHAGTTYGRCPDGTGDFGTQTAVTKGAANACGPVEPPTLPWPASARGVETVDVTNTWTSNLSGLTYQPATATAPAVLWAGVNGPGTLFRLLDDGVNWVPDTSNDWGAGKALRYPNGAGNPDTEGVTKTAWDSPFVYASIERNNDQSTVSRLGILRFDTSAAGPTLTATHEWNLTADLPVVGANLGLEAITWVPDEFLVASSFYDENAAGAYDPSAYPDHAGGLFFVGVEGTGFIYAYALDHTSSSFARVASIESGHPGVMGLEFDREVGYLWATCDDSCGNLASVLTPDATPGSPSAGRFIVRRTYQPPTTLPNANNEGFALAPDSECSSGQKNVFWSDDNDTGGNSLRRGSFPCGAQF